MKNNLIVLALCFLSWSLVLLPGYADEHAKEPAFGHYTTTEIYSGKPASVDFSSDPDAKRFKTKLSVGIKKGVNFAGSYTIVSWGCGTNCTQSAILETKTGKVCAWFNSCGGERYKQDSKLLIVNPAEKEVNPYPSGCQTEYYLWNGIVLDRIEKNR